MMSIISGYVIEIDQNFRNGKHFELYTIKDYFYYDSNVKEYTNRDTIIPVECIHNKEDLPDEETIKRYINNKIPVMERLIDINKQEENWIFTNIEEPNDN